MLGEDKTGCKSRERSPIVYLLVQDLKFSTNREIHFPLVSLKNEQDTNGDLSHLSHSLGKNITAADIIRVKAV